MHNDNTAYYRNRINLVHFRDDELTMKGCCGLVQQHMVVAGR